MVFLITNTERRVGNRAPGKIFNHRATSHSALVVERYAAIRGGDNPKFHPI